MAPPSRTPLLQSIEIFIYCYKLALHYGFNEEHFLKNIVNMLGFFSPSGCHTSQIYASISPSCGEKSSLQFAFLDESFLKYILLSLDLYNLVFFSSVYDLCMSMQKLKYETNTEHTGKHRSKCETKLCCGTGLPLSV